MKMMHFFLLVFSFYLTGCFDDTTDIQHFMIDVEASSKAQIQPLPAIRVFEHLPYSGSDLRNPFSLPSADAHNQSGEPKSVCIQPASRGAKQALEKFAIDNLTMRGTLGHAAQLWALIEASDQSVHRISVDDRLGLFQGKVTAVKPDYIEITEFIPDGMGCSVQRNSRLQLVHASADIAEAH